jgi:transposase InsO family protein
VVDKTLSEMTQMVDTVEAETWEHMRDQFISHMRDHFVSRLPELKVHRVNDMACVDTFFSSITSVWGFTCWTQYYFLKSSFDAVYLMRRRSQGPSTLPKMVTDCGAPNQIRSDNGPKFKGQTWMTYLRKHQIQSDFTEAYHPNENPCEH